MGWRDRDYARFTDEERRILYGTDRPSHRAGPSYTVPGQGRLFGSRVRPMPGIVAAVIVSLLVALALGQLPRSHPLIPQLHLNFPSLSSPAKTASLALPSSLRLGSSLTLHGRLGGGEAGTVTVEGEYGEGPWQVLAKVPADNGAYEARIPLSQTGPLKLRVTYPDGHQAAGETYVG